MNFQASPALVALLLLGTLAGCAKQPAFVETPDLGRIGRSKAKYEQISICFSDGDKLATLQKLADEECARGQKKAHYLGYQRWQCRLMVPHLASFVCLDPSQALEEKKKYLGGGGTGLPPVDKPDESQDLFGTFGTFGFGK